MRKLIALALFALPAVANAQFLVSDPVPSGQGVYTISHCAFTRGTVTTLSPVEVVTGGVRCHIDLSADPKTGTVTVAYRDNVLGVTGPTSSLTFGALPNPLNPRVIP